MQQGESCGFQGGERIKNERVIHEMSTLNE